MIAVKCAGCGHSGKAPEALAGKSVACPKCGSAVAVPGFVEVPVLDVKIDTQDDFGLVPTPPPKGWRPGAAFYVLGSIGLLTVGSLIWAANAMSTMHAQAKEVEEERRKAEFARRTEEAFEVNDQLAIKRAIVSLMRSIEPLTGGSADRFSFTQDPIEKRCALSMRLCNPPRGYSHAVLSVAFNSADRASPQRLMWLTVGKRGKVRDEPSKTPVILALGDQILRGDLSLYRDPDLEQSGVVGYICPFGSSMLQAFKKKPFLGLRIDEKDGGVTNDDLLAMQEFLALIDNPSRPMPGPPIPAPTYRPKPVRQPVQSPQLRDPGFEAEARAKQEDELRRKTQQIEREIRETREKQLKATRLAKAAEKPIPKNAIRYYREVIEIDPTTEEAELARQRIAEIEAIPERKKP